MATKDITVKVSKESYELGEGMASFIGAVKAALADGWNLGDDLPAIVSAAMTNLVPAVDGLTELDDEWAEDKASFMRAWALAGAQVFEKLQPPAQP